MIIQLNPPIPIKSKKGTGLAHFLIDQGPEHDLQWVTFLDDNGECWTFQNRDIRAQKNITQGREYVSPFYNPDECKLDKSKSSGKSLKDWVIQFICPKCLTHDAVHSRYGKEWKCQICESRLTNG